MISSLPHTHVFSTRLHFISRIQLVYQEFSNLIFQNVCQMINNPLKCILSLAYRWRNIVLTIIFWVKVDYCFPIMSYDGPVQCLIFKWWLRSSALFNEPNIIHMSMSVSRRLHVLCISSRIERWSEHHCSPSYMRELKCYSHGEHLHDRIM